MLTYSNWEAGTVCFSESFESLSEGLQNALWELGKVPERHRTDRLTAAVNNTTRPAEFTERYQALLRYYGLAGRRSRPAGQRERRRRAEASPLQAGRGPGADAARQPRLRQCGRVSALPAGAVRALNAGRRQRLRRRDGGAARAAGAAAGAAKRERVKVDSGSLIHVDRNTYSVPSRLIGERWKRGCAWTGRGLVRPGKVDEMPRLRGRGKHRVDYRHVIDWLVRKPGAFEDYRYRESCSPPAASAWPTTCLQERHGSRGRQGVSAHSPPGGAGEREQGGRGVAHASAQAEEPISARTRRGSWCALEAHADLREVVVGSCGSQRSSTLIRDTEVLQ